jgi:hypothetical protein
VDHKQKKQEISRLESELLSAYNNFCMFLSYEQIRSFRNYFGTYETIIKKEITEGMDFPCKRFLLYKLEVRYSELSVWNGETIEDFFTKRQCSKSFFEYKRCFKNLVVLQTAKPSKKRNSVLDFSSFQNELLLR